MKSLFALFAPLLIFIGSTTSFVTPFTIARPIARPTARPIARTTFTNPNVATTTAIRSTTYDLEGLTLTEPLTPVGNFMVVKVKPDLEETSGGIILTKKSRVKNTFGTVVSIGPGKLHPDSGKLIPVPFPINSNVLYGPYDGTEVLYGGEKHMLIRDDDVLVYWGGGRGRS